MDHLPDELLADILRRLPPRGVAACRTVSKGWRAAVDDRGMLLAVAPLVPRPMQGILINFSSHGRDRPYLFSRGPTVNPSTVLDVDACTLDFMRHVCRRGYPTEIILDHRNGLLLYMNGKKTLYVCNPATRRWAELPPVPLPRWSAAYLVFDPVVSLHYDVLVFRNTGKDNTPPFVYMVHVYSSRTERWEECPFTPEGDATTITIRLDQPGDPKRRGAVYWRGALYLHRCSGFIIRLSLDKKTYLVIKTPKLTMMPTTYGYSTNSKPRVYLGKSEQGVYYTTIYRCQLQVWLLEESKSCPMPKWVLKHHSHLAPCVLRHYNKRYCEGVKADNSCSRRDCEWEFIDANVHDSEEQEGELKKGQRRNYYDDNRIEFLGYHPYKDIAFLGINNSDGFSYYLGTFQLRYLGSIFPTGWRRYQVAIIQESFIYTPCKDDLLPDPEELIKDLFEELFI